MKYKKKSNRVLNPKRIALLIQYNGAGYSGWQRQPNQLTIQQILEESISQLSSFNPAIAIAAGRTDAGVHASGQVVHFDYSGPIPPNRWAAALNGRLPSSIRVIKSTESPKYWHACFSAIYRRYRYTIYNGCSPNLFLEPWSWHRYQYQIDESLIHDALEGLIGFHDFTAFQKAGSKRKNAYTTIQDFQVKRIGDLIEIELQATGFLYGMMRLLVGQLVALGEHKLKLKDFEKRWKECRREEVRESAPAKGLCFLKAGYKEDFLMNKTSYKTFPTMVVEALDSPLKPTIGH